uniref:Hint domain-containing protein n=1 Tax=Compsopogon caeruleus TaxID=31354 RepID=A0A7S1TJP3_9RHOD
MSVMGVQGQSNPSWTMPSVQNVQRRHEHALVQFYGRLYLIGGRGDLPVEEYTHETQSWKTLNVPPFGEVHHFQAQVYYNRIVVGGAWKGSYPNESNFDSVYMYDPVADVWELNSTMPAGRSRGSTQCVVYNDKVYFVNGNVGGHGGGSVAMNLFDEFDPRTGAWVTLVDSPISRDHGGAVVSGSKMFVVGGRDSGHDDWDNPVWARKQIDVYDFTPFSGAHGRWTTLTEVLPEPQPGGGYAIVDSLIVLAGGEIWNGTHRPALDSTQFVDTSTNTIKTYSPAVKLNTPRNGVPATSCGGLVFVVDGSSSMAQEEYTTMEYMTLGGVTCKSDPAFWTGATPTPTAMNPSASSVPPPSSTPVQLSSSLSPTTSISPSTLTGSQSTSPESSASSSPSSNLRTGSPSANSSGSNSACFPGDAQVVLDDGRSIQMREIRVGNRIKTGSNRFSTVFAFTHRQDSQRDQLYVEITAATGPRLELTPSHLIYVNDYLVPASDVKPGHSVLVTIGDRVEPTEVTSVRHVRRSAGLYNPQTQDGNILVNGFVVSCYTETVYPTIAHALLLPARLVHRWLPQVDALGGSLYNDAPNAFLALARLGQRSA